MLDKMNGIRREIGLFAFGTLLIMTLISSGCAQAPIYSFPEANELPENAFHPDPFLKADGTRVSSLEEWPEQREYLKALVERYLYGTVPPRPTRDELSVERLFDRSYSPPNSRTKGRNQGYRISISRNGLVHSFRFNLWRPVGEKRYPTLINNAPEHGHPDPTYSMAEGVRRGYVLVEFEREEVAPDELSNVGRETGIFRLYPEYEFQAIAAWGWAYQPIIDALDRLGLVDMEQIIVTGHSRGGTDRDCRSFDRRTLFAWFDASTRSRGISWHNGLR